MHVGLGLFFQGLEPGRDDHAVLRDQLALADAAEAGGFESIWTPEHHFSRYHMMPNPLQVLTYLAGRTRTVRLGTMVVVLPWHDPVRVAEETAWLDSVSGGRAVLGLGRGLGAIEFDGFHSFGGMPAEVARRNVAVFTERVLPRLSAIDPHRRLGSTAADVARAG